MEDNVSSRERQFQTEKRFGKDSDVVSYYIFKCSSVTASAIFWSI